MYNKKMRGKDLNFARCPVPNHAQGCGITDEMRTPGTRSRDMIEIRNQIEDGIEELNSDHRLPDEDERYNSYKSIDQVIEDMRSELSGDELKEFDDALEDGRKWVQSLSTEEKAKMFQVEPVASKCDTCKNHHGSLPSDDYPYPEHWCSKDHWSGLGPDEFLGNIIFEDPWKDCPDYTEE